MIQHPLEQEMDHHAPVAARCGAAIMPCEISTGTTEGLRRITLGNGMLRADILLDKGANVRQIWDEASGARLLAETSDWTEQLSRFHHSGRRGTSYASCYEGGWQDVLPARARWDSGSIGEDEGVGEAAIIPWQVTRSVATPAAVQCICSAHLPRCGLEVSKRFRIRRGVAAISVETCVRNSSRSAVRFSWTQHPALGGDLLDDTSHVWLPGGQAGVNGVFGDFCEDGDGADFTATAGDRWTPTQSLLPAHGSPDRFTTIAHVHRGEAALGSNLRGLGVRLSWDTLTFPHLWFWCARRSSICCVAIEPSTTSLPERCQNASQETLHLLRPGESIRTWMKLSTFATLRGFPDRGPLPSSLRPGKSISVSGSGRS